MENFFRLPYVGAVYVLAAIIASIQSLLLPLKSFGDGYLHTHYNNYIIFKNSFWHLVHEQDLYVLYRAEQWDLFKYSPTFSLVFGVLAVLPNWLGLCLWNAFNALVLYWGVTLLPNFNERKKIYLLFFIFLEMLTSIQNAQSNALIAGLLLAAFAFMEKEQPAKAALLVACTVFIKLFSILFLGLILLYPQRWRFISWLVWACGVFTILPLVIVSPEQLQFLYSSWVKMLANDHSLSTGLSVMGWLETWFHFSPNKFVVLAVGAFLFLLPLLRFSRWREINFRYVYFAQVLLWVIIFNHRAESATFIIASAGAAVYFFLMPFSLINCGLAILLFVFTILSPTDFFPAYIRGNLVQPYVLKAVPCILLWGKIIIELIMTSSPHELSQSVG